MFPPSRPCLPNGQWAIRGWPVANSPALLQPLLVGRIEAARCLGVSPGTIDNLRLRGELPSVKIAARRLFDTADLRQFIAARKGVSP